MAQWSHQVGAVPGAVKGAVRWALGVLVHHPVGRGMARFGVNIAHIHNKDR